MGHATRPTRDDAVNTSPVRLPVRRPGGAARAFSIGVAAACLAALPASCGNVSGGISDAIPAGCAWRTIANRETLNVAYPDADATYWGTGYRLGPGERLVLRGEFPGARYFSFVTYDDVGTPVDSRADRQVEPDPGSANPFRPGAPPATAVGRNYRVELSADALPGDGGEAIAIRAPGSTAKPVTGSILYRVYVPDDPGSPSGGAALPSVSLVRADGNEHPVPTCERPGTNPDVVRLIEENGPATDRPAPPAPVFIRPTTTANLFANPDNVYVATLLAYRPGVVVVLRGLAPTFPDTRAGASPALATDVRYWSFCTNEWRKPYPVTDCAADFEIPLDAGGNYTFVVSTPEDRPSNATVDHGVAWLDWGDTGTDVLLLARQMLASSGFPGAAARLEPGEPAIPAMGAWAPRGVYCEPAVFEGGGAAACGL